MAFFQLSKTFTLLVSKAHRQTKSKKAKDSNKTLRIQRSQESM